MAAAVLADRDRPAELGEGALRAGRPVADFAPRADRHDGGGVVRRMPCGVDQPFGVGDVAAEPDGEVPLRGKVAPPLPAWSGRSRDTCARRASAPPG